MKPTRATLLPPIWLSIYVLVLVMWLGVFYLPLYFASFPVPIDYLDFSYYYAGARIGLEHGWGRIYDLDLQRQVFYQLHPAADAFDWSRYFVSPLPVAWLVAPLTALPLVPAFWLFAGLSATAFFITVWVAAPCLGLARVALVLTAGCVYPVLIAVQTGQVTPLIGAATVMGWWLARSGRQVAAGLVLVVLVLKPQVAALVPVVLLIAGQRRLFLAWLAGGAGLGLLSLASLGTHGLDQLRTAVALEQGQPANLVWTVAGLFGHGPLSVGVGLFLAGLALTAAWGLRQRSLELVVVAGILGTLLVAPYHNPSDFALLAPAACLYLRARVPAWHWAWLVAGLGASYAAARLGPVALLIFTIGWLGLLGSEALRLREPSGERMMAAEAQAAQAGS